jgi:2,3,4,5-tetrahydropyridine-2-carboxylate N-succinyltransferase
MQVDEIRSIIEECWEAGPTAPNDRGQLLQAIDGAIDLLDVGEIRAVEAYGSGYRAVEWVKKALLLNLRHHDPFVIAGLSPPGGPAPWYDKARLKFEGWGADDFERARLRVVPPAAVRKSAYLAPDVILMPCFVNLGAHVGAGTMIDTWATVGSCAQVGSGCHISGGAGIGGVLEPVQAMPVVVEDGVFVGARSEITEGVVVRRGAVIGMGVFLTASTKIVDRETLEVFVGEVPEYAVVVPGAIARPDGRSDVVVSVGCGVIIKRVDERTRAKTSINELLRGTSHSKV